MTKILSHSSSFAPRRTPMLQRVSDALVLYKQRRRLGSLDDAALRDIGVSRTEASREAQRPVWDAPKNWFR